MPVSVSPESRDLRVSPGLAVAQRDTVMHVLVPAVSPESHVPRVSPGLAVSPDICGHVRASANGVPPWRAVTCACHWGWQCPQRAVTHMWRQR